MDEPTAAVTMGSMRPSLLKAFDVLLRVPLLYVMDMICSSKASLTLNAWNFIFHFVNFISFPIIRSSVIPNSQTFEILSEITFQDFYMLALYAHGFMVAFTLLMLNTSQLLSIYLAIASVGVIVWSYILNEEYVKYCSVLIDKHSSLQNEMFILNREAFQVFFGNYFSQAFLATIFCFSSMNLPNFPPKKFFFGILFLCPTVINAALPSTVVLASPELAAILAFIILMCYFFKHVIHIPGFIISLIISWHIMIRQFGIQVFVQVRWSRLHLTHVLRMYWITRMFKEAIFLLYEHMFSDNFENDTYFLDTKSLIEQINVLAVRGCDNIVAVMGMATIFALILNKSLFQPVVRLLNGPPQEVTCALSLLFVILAVESGLTAMPEDKRSFGLYSIILLLVVVVISQTHIKSSQILLSLSSGNRSYGRHLRVIFVCVITFLVSCVYLVYFCTSFQPSTWLLAVSTFLVEIILKLIIAFIIYTMNIVNEKSTKTWYGFYDYVYSLEGFSFLVSFICGIFLFLNGLYILIFESTGVVRLFFTIMYCYKNLWCAFRKEWDIFKKRCMISKCVKSLFVTRPEQVASIDCLCAICYDDFSFALICVTRCNHYFHGHCLKKWLNEKHTCPICHGIIFNDERRQRNLNRYSVALHLHQD